MLPAVRLAFADDELGIMVAPARDRALNGGKGFPHPSTLLFQFPVFLPQFLILPGTFEAFGFDFTHSFSPGSR